MIDSECVAAAFCGGGRGVCLFNESTSWCVCPPDLELDQNCLSSAEAGILKEAFSSWLPFQVLSVTFALYLLVVFALFSYNDKRKMDCVIWRMVFFPVAILLELVLFVSSPLVRMARACYCSVDVKCWRFSKLLSRGRVHLVFPKPSQDEDKKVPIAPGGDSLV